MTFEKSGGMELLLECLAAQEVKSLAGALGLRRSGTKADVAREVLQNLRGRESQALAEIPAAALKEAIRCLDRDYALAVGKLSARETRSVASAVFLEGQHPPPNAAQWLGARVTWGNAADTMRSSSVPGDAEINRLYSEIQSMASGAVMANAVGTHGISDDSDELESPLDPQQLKDRFEADPLSTFRGRMWQLPAETAESPTDLYLHQVACVESLETTRVSGIICLPTGAGKTRVALEYIARQLRKNPGRRFIWATYPTQLVRQAMARAVELGPRFPAGTSIAWADSDMITDPDFDLDDADILFVMRDQLADLMERASDRRVNDSLSDILGADWGDDGPRVTLIYDECHQLGAEGLQKAWRRFDRWLAEEKLQDRFRAIGLSATPLPTRQEALPFFRDTIFKVRDLNHSCRGDWGVQVFQQVKTQDLYAQNILCPIDRFLDDTGDFRIPDRIVRKIKEATPKPPKVRNPLLGPTGEERWELEQFARHFDVALMGSDEVLDHLADAIGKHFKTMGKTLVFAPDIRSAELLVKRLAAVPNIGKGRVSLVHSRLDELPFEHASDSPVAARRRAEDPAATIAKFRARGHEPCILVNVSMLTTGFDDPQVKTVVLARTTFSPNLFWQMIGRGTRGTASRGTDRCYVIDPIRLTELYGVLRGYAPTLDTIDQVNLGSEGEDGREVVLPPDVVVNEIPAPSDLDEPLIIDPALSRARPDVAAAVLAFLNGTEVPREVLAGALLATKVELADGELIVRERPHDEALGPTLLFERVHQAEKALGSDLSWLKTPKHLPATASEMSLFLAKCAKVEKERLLTEDDWNRYWAQLMGT